MMDDFGSGYSSLNMLKDTNVDAIKLDMKLIDMNQQNRSKGVQIVESVVDMAHRLNLPIIAEGVETPEQVSMLQAADCLYTQGYYFYKPMPVENAEALLAQPNSEDYWDMRRDLLRRNRRSPISDSKQTTLALQAYQIFADNVLELSLLNLSTGKYRVIKRDPRLPGIGSDAEEDFAAYCERIVTNKVIHPDDAEMFTDQTDLEALRSAVFSTQQPEAYRFRKNVSGQFVWITMEFLPCRNCCAQNPWATVVVREDAQADQLSEELDFSYSHDTLTGLLNRSLFETDLRTLQSSEYDSMVCTYIDVVGLHEINNHLGHRSGDSMLCFIANAAGQAGLLRPQRSGAPAARPEREAGADPDRKAGCRALPAGPCPQVQECVRCGPEDRPYARCDRLGLFPENSGHLRRLFPRRSAAVP